VNSAPETAQPGDLVQLVGQTHKHFIIRLIPGSQLQTHRGIINHDDLIGKPWGSEILSHLGKPFYLFQPSLSDLILNIRRTTQIIFPKDVGYILVKMGISPGQTVIEAGTGSGALTTALAFAVGPMGRVITYEIRSEMLELARHNLESLGLSDRTIFKLRDIRFGFDETDAPALFMDIPRPQDYLAQVRAALRPGGFFGCILPTTNQVTDLLPALHRENFAFIEVCEIFLRFYKPVPERLRPTDRMVAHTGYLVFARPIITMTHQVPLEGSLSK
jgi:tRNA (adenine57-N1/adenine58-N1)-methyltransferase